MLERARKKSDSNSKQKHSSTRAPSTPTTMAGSSMYEGGAAAFAYMASSVALILFNKVALSVYEFPHVNIVILTQLILSSTLLLLSKRVFGWITFYNKVKLPVVEEESAPEEKEDPRERTLISIPTLQQTFPLSLSYFAYLILGMFALRAVTIPMYTTLRRLSTFFVMLIEAIWLNTSYSLGVKASVFFMIFGALLAGIKDLDSNFYGYFLVMAYNMATAVYVVLIGKLGKVTGLNNWGLIFYNNILCTPLVILLTLYTGELAGVLTDFSYWFGQPGFVVSMTGSAFLAFLLNFAIFWNTSANSPLTQSVTGQFKDFATVVVGLLLFGDDVSQDPLKLTGVLIGFGASIYYAYAKYTSARYDKQKQKKEKN